MGREEVLMAKLSSLTMVALLLAGCAAGSPAGPSAPAAAGGAPAATDWDRAEPIDIVLTDFAFGPERIVLHVNHRYRLHLENRGSGGHNLAAPDFFRTATLRDDAAGGEARSSGAIEVARGAAKDTYVEPLRPGTFPVECTHLLHALFGMTGQIVVE
jgi:plastocyanin